jgi:hypothetical protein
VWIAESDDYADDRLLAQVVPALDEDPKVAFAYCRSRSVSAAGNVGRFADSYLLDLDPQRWVADYSADGEEECRKYFVIFNIIPNASAVVFRKNVYESVGGADENLRLCGDWKLWAAMALTGRVAYRAEPLNYFRFHNQSVRNETNRLNLDITENFHVVRWLLDRVEPTKTTIQATYAQLAKLWVPAVLSARVPLREKWAILREVTEIDPNPVRHAVRPALVTLRLKVERHFPFVKDFRAIDGGIGHRE